LDNKVFDIIDARCNYEDNTMQITRLVKIHRKKYIIRNILTTYSKLPNNF